VSVLFLCQIKILSQRKILIAKVPPLLGAMRRKCWKIRRKLTLHQLKIPITQFYILTIQYSYHFNSVSFILMPNQNFTAKKILIAKVPPLLGTVRLEI
jgi:hypothetical protein